MIKKKHYQCPIELWSWRLCSNYTLNNKKPANEDFVVANLKGDLKILWRL